MKSKLQLHTLRTVITTRRTLRRITPTSSWFRGDKVLWIIITMLAVVSVLVVYSSTAKMAYDDAAIKSTSQFLQQQIGALVFGAIALFGSAYLFSSKFFRGVAPWVYGLSIALTLLVYFKGGATNGAARWINIAGFQFQPSEALKVATIMFLARQLAARQKVIDTLRLLPNPFKLRDKEEWRVLKSGFCPILLPMLASCVIVLPAHTSSAALIFVSSMVVFMIGRVNWRELVKIVGLAFAFLLLFFAIGAGRSDTAGGRFSTWVDLWTQDRSEVAAEDLADTERSMIAMYNGGLTGVGAGKSVMRVEMIHPESDYAFAFFVEEYGSLPAIAVMLFYLWIFFRAITIVERCGAIFPSLLVLGLAMMITTQALAHIAVTINLMPETGQTLPLISRGGSSLLFNAIALGMILSVSRQTEEGTHDTSKSQSIYEE